MEEPAKMDPAATLSAKEPPQPAKLPTKPHASGSSGSPPVKKHKSNHHKSSHHKSSHHHSSDKSSPKKHSKSGTPSSSKPSSKPPSSSKSSSSSTAPVKKKRPMISESDSEEDIPLSSGPRILKSFSAVDVQQSVSKEGSAKSDLSYKTALTSIGTVIKSEKGAEPQPTSATGASKGEKIKTEKIATQNSKTTTAPKVKTEKHPNDSGTPSGTPLVKVKSEKTPSSSTSVKKEKSSSSVKVKGEKRKSKSNGTDVPLAKRKPAPHVTTPSKALAGSKRKKESESEESEYTDDDEYEDAEDEFKPSSSKKGKKAAPAPRSKPSTPASKTSTPSAKSAAKKKPPPSSSPTKKETPASKKKGAGNASPTKGGKKKKEDEAPVWKWWEEEPHPNGIKWLTLEHRGPYFAPAYEPLPPEVEFVYDGEAMKLSEKAEEAAGFFAKMLDHDYTTKDVFCSNFFDDWRKEMTAEEARVISDFSKCDFTQIHQHYKDRSEARKAMTKEEKLVIKQENEKLVEEYGWCMIDGHKEKIGNFKIEPPGLFRGRGDHPKQGKIKKRIEARDVMINIGKKAKIPSPPPEQRWKEVHHDNKVTWLASWTENIQGSIKYVMLNPTSRLKAEKDWAKYETARRLKTHVDRIRGQYREDLKSKEMRVRQRAVAMYFIDKLALRAGNEKDTDESADTVGCCSLRVEHIKLHEEKDGKEYVIEFDFLGKDSIRYYNCVPVDKQVFKDVRLFVNNKTGGDDLFDRLTTSSLNKHLTELMENLTAKVFRTYNASKTLQEQLDELTVAEDSVTSKLLAYNRANRAVAVLCNHQRAPPKTFDKQMSNLQGKIEGKEDAITEVRAEVKALKKEARSTKDSKTTKKLDMKQRQLARLEEQLHKLETQATDKQENKEIALSTSKLNYLDPRISVAWCKKWEVPVEKIYNKTQRQKFAWAIDMADEDFVF